MSMLNCGGGGEGVCVNMPKQHRNLILHRFCLMGMLVLFCWLYLFDCLKEGRSFSLRFLEIPET